jgi:hypothetical protein
MVDAIVTLTALNGPFFIIPEQSLLLHYIVHNGEPHLKAYSLANCTIGTIQKKKTLCTRISNL